MRLRSKLGGRQLPLQAGHARGSLRHDRAQLAPVGFDNI
jgi:hypothetical protein